MTDFTLQTLKHLKQNIWFRFSERDCIVSIISLINSSENHMYFSHNFKQSLVFMIFMIGEIYLKLTTY